MDIESRKLIEQMLAEEEYYYQQDSLPNSSKKRKDAIIDSDYSFLPNDSFKKTKKEGKKKNLSYHHPLPFH